MITGARLKDEVRALARITGSIKDLKVTFNGGALEAGSSTGSISLPMIPSNVVLNDLEAKEFRGLSDHESFHHRYTDLELWQKVAEYCDACNDPISMSVWNGAEDPRIERLGIAMFPGTRTNLQKTCDKWVNLLNDHAGQSDNPMGFLAVKIAYLGRLNGGFEFDLPEKQELAKQFVALGMDDELKALSVPDDGTELLEGVANFLHSKGVPTLRNFLDGVPAPDKDDEEDKSEGGNNKGEGAIAGSELGNEMVNPDLESITKSFQCDVPYYAREDMLNHSKLSPRSDASEVAHSEYRKYAAGFARALKVNLQTRKDRSRLVGHLNGSRLVDAYNRGDSVWKSKKSAERGFNTALSFILDCSGSMSTHIGQTVNLTKALAEAVRSAGIPFEITGFTEWDEFQGHHLSPDPSTQYVREGSMQVYEAKGFDDVYDHRRLDALRFQNRGFTPDSEALELGLARMVGRREARKVIVILTDGSPQTMKDFVVINDTYHDSSEIILSHREAVLKQAKQDGIEVYCIAVGHREVQHYEPSHTMSIRSFDDLNHRMFDVFYKALTTNT